MNSKEFLSEEAAQEYMDQLIADDNTADIIDLHTGIYLVRWIKNKKFTTFDNKEFTDEVWTTEDGTMVLVQDLSPEHARNIIRMILRNSRAMSIALIDALEDALAEPFELTYGDSANKKTLH